MSSQHVLSYTPEVEKYAQYKESHPYAVRTIDNLYKMRTKFL
ncbi:hypothetical protein [Anaplasma phagocytophilum]|nr:hypothetical protein [Anaplasma phagocytophilum]